MLPESEDFGNFYYEAYKVNPVNVKKGVEWKKIRKKISKLRYKQKNKVEFMCENDNLPPPEIELPGNASAFAVFASIRLSVLDRWMRQASQEFLQSSCSIPSHEQSENDTDTEDNTQSSTYMPVKVSKIVGLGLRSVFELIKESRISHPTLCTKALLALLDVLQGQTPEGLKSEPMEIIDPLFELLLDLATLHGPETSVPNDGSHLTAIACACLLSLVVVRGDTGKCLSAAAALLMCPRALSIQNILMPTVLSSLQRSVHGVLLGKMARPDWMSHGVPNNTKLDSFSVKIPKEIQTGALTFKSLACDGQYLYLFTSKGLFKIGSGYGGTLKGHISVWKPDFYPNDNGSLVFCAGNLYIKLCGRRGGEFLIVERSNLLISGSVSLHSRDAAASVIFSDGEYLGTISTAKDDGFVVRLLNQNTAPASVISELPLKLAMKSVYFYGVASFDDDGANQNLSNGSDEEVSSICAGKEFGLVKTINGKILYRGKASALGIKQSGVRAGKWSELVLNKMPKVCMIAMGHDGLHAILITEDGSVFFTGTAKRGEDGDQSKVRRQSKPLKPKKMIKVDGQHIVSGACNNGTTALINKDGELMMFGKDTAHADPNTGFVNMKGEIITQVALGKAHALALTNKGQIFSFGINNKFQCGRDFIGTTKEGVANTNVVAMETGGIPDENCLYEEGDENEKGNNMSGESEGNSQEQQNMCQSGMHVWHDDLCMICTNCRECTGYSISCLSSMSAERNPGQECGCGEGDSGCSVCGCCRICAREVVDNSELADLAGMMRLDLIFRDKMLIPPRQRTKLQEQLQSRLDERKNRGRKSVASSSKPLVKARSARSSISSTSSHHRSSNNAVKKANGLAKEQVSSDVERDATRVACLSPAKVQLLCDSPVIQIACGLHHSVLLLQNGRVVTFGSNLYGQLGCGDILAKNNIQMVDLPGNAIHIAAGSNHTVVLTSKGEVFTFGNHQKGQLGRNSSHDVIQPDQSSSSRYSNPRSPWYSVPGLIPNIGIQYGRRATWVGASGDQTFLKVDESLINSVSISKSTVTANKYSLVLIPNQEDMARNFKCLVINKKDGTCNSFKGDQMDFYNKIVCMDPLYNVLWSYNPLNHELACYNIILSDLQCSKIINKNIAKKNAKNGKNENNLPLSLDSKINIGSIITPELALPIATNCQVTRFQAALNLLCTLDTLIMAHEHHIAPVSEDIDERQHVSGKQYSKEDFQMVNRFESHGGGWGYSGHSIEAIRFMCDSDILLGGFGLFGGRGEYTAKMKLMDIGPDGGEQEGDGELLTETEEIPYDCGPRQKYPMLFEEPIQLQANRWYVALCHISGPSSDCGSSGQTMVTTEDQVLFYFKSSKKSNNGTDVNAGQIPQLLYKVITPDNKTPPRQADLTEPVHVLSKDFSRTVTKECFQSLLSLLQWSWNTFKSGVMDGQGSKNMYTNLELEKLVYISNASLRLIKTYVNEIYPNQVSKRIPLENVHLAESVGSVRSLLKQILSDNIPNSAHSTKCTKTRNQTFNMMNNLLDECHETFVSCFHAFYPTAYLKWTCLCDLLNQTEKEKKEESITNIQRLLSAVICALCAPSVRLRSTFPLMGYPVSADNSLHRGLSPSDNTGLPMMSVSDSHHYPILVEQMSHRSQMESSFNSYSWLWRDILEHLLNITAEPIIKCLNRDKNLPLYGLTKHCCHLLARVVAELVHQCSCTEEDIQSGNGRILHMTPSRFTRTNQSRTWNTGNGSPDAICFQVDHPGISIVGVGVYGGIGHYEYELELLEDSSLSGNDSHTQAHRWNSLESTRGSFGPEDFAPDIIEIKFDRAVPVKENVKYALKLRNHGGRTNNGDGGLNSVKGSDNTTFTFSTCSLSFNGTTLTRGQIPILLYYSNPIECGRTSTTKLEQQARKTAISITSSIIESASKLMVLAREKAEEEPSADILSGSCLVTTLLPLVLAHISPLATSDSKCAVHLLNLIYEILPHVAALNLVGMNKISPGITNHELDHKSNTTSHYYTWVQSDHPYKQSSVTNYRVKFPHKVKWMSLEFDPQCATAQPEDSLQLYVPSMDYTVQSKTQKYFELTDDESPPFPYWPVFQKFNSNTQWPSNAVILPGNEVIFSLETASDYLKDDRASSYGFKCLVIGYDWPATPETDNLSGLENLEAELSFLGGMCAASLMKKDLLLPSLDDNGEVDIEMAEVVTTHTFKTHSSLLSKGLSLNNPPTINQALDGMLPYSVHSNERLFLKDFVGCVAGTSGGRLAQWLEPGSRVEPSKCQVLYSKDDLRCGWPAMITVVTRDQYSDLVHVPNMKVDIKAIPIDKTELGDCEAGRKMRRVSQPDPLTFGGLPPPPLHQSYEPTIREKMCFHSITVMKQFQNYSFEELRYNSPTVKRSSENMLVRPNCDGTYSGTWTPASVGCYSIVVNIDGYEMEEIFKVEVAEPPQGMTPPNQNIAKKTAHQPSKLRKFVAKNSAGLRIRAHPSLQSEQIGVVHVNGTIAFIDEIHNDDGVWLRLSNETIRQYCSIPVIEAWCLQYNQHLGKTLLLPVEELKSVLDKVGNDAGSINVSEVRKTQSKPSAKYQVIKCGASGHNIRSKPNLTAPPIGMLILGNTIGVKEYIVNSDGCWVLLDQATKNKYCFNNDEEAWSLAMGHNNVLYLGNLSEETPEKNVSKRGFTFSNKQTEPPFSFTVPTTSIPVQPAEPVSTNPFIFGETTRAESPKFPKREIKDANSQPKWFKSDEVKSFIDKKEYISNGNGVTPPDTPKHYQSQKNGQNTFKLKHQKGSPFSSSSNDSRDEPDGQFDRSTSKSPFSSLERGESSQNAKSEDNEDKENEEDQNMKKVTQTGTQTSPENLTAIKANFSIGTLYKEERISPKLLRKERGSVKVRPKRSISPANLQNLTPKSNFSACETAKPASSPSVAESLRAVFAAVLWHEGIVHDAMACASFLKFHPNLPKQGALVTTRHPEYLVDKRKEALTKEEKARQRHSVEVSNAGNYLNIQPSTLESLTKSAANASANRNRGRKTAEGGPIKEESSEKVSENVYQTVSILPPALKSLVYLWEELTTNCIQTLPVEPTSPEKIKNKKSDKSDSSRNDSRDKNSVVEKESKKNRKKKSNSRNYLEDIGMPSYLNGSSESETVCELCGEQFAPPVTYHMHQIHPGCGQHAGGKGYNSGGNYCLGWAGNCGDGGIPGSSWYLLCEACREKFIKQIRGGKVMRKYRSVHRRRNDKYLNSPALSTGTEPHITIKNNAMFLLDLASSADNNISSRRRPSSSIMPSVSENNSPPDCSGPFAPVPPFQCLNSLGVFMNKDDPFFYEEIFRNHSLHGGFTSDNYNNGQRPLSDISDDLDITKGLRFHRSVSMGTNGMPWAKGGLDGRVIMLRKRNNSGGEIPNDGGSSLLCNPSNALQKLVKKKYCKVPENGSNFNELDEDTLLDRPVLSFLLQQHDLESLQIAMRHALRKATCRVYAMQALNWLLRSVTQPNCLHDLLWWFVTSLTPVIVDPEPEEDNRPPKKVEDQELFLCEHPLSDIKIAGDAVYPLPSTFHALLQTIADLMVILPIGSPLQQMAVRCWGIKFESSDHSFLHRSQVFSNISKILSRSDEMEDCTISMHESHMYNPGNSVTTVECLKDLTGSVEIKASSRQAMIGSLTDGSTETFWESGDEDRNKTKSLTILCSQGNQPNLICVHIDNCRDLGNKTSNIIFYTGPNTDELVKIRTIEIDTRRLGGWINCPILNPIDCAIRLELKGPDNSVRVRQLKILGHIEGETLKIGKLYSAATIQQRNCEAETLRVFRLITSQVFGKLIEGDETNNLNNLSNSLNMGDNLDEIEENNDLREHMVGILFSRSKLTHLQKQVIVHIVQAIRKETLKIYEEWKTMLSSTSAVSNQSLEISKSSDTYCFEMLSMVLALSGSTVGRSYLSQQSGLLSDVVNLLHTGSARVQRQVTSLLRRMLPEMSPEYFAKVMGVTNLPSKDFSIISVTNKGSKFSNLDHNRSGILDVFLSIIAKALTVQVKIKSKHGGSQAKEVNTVTLFSSITASDNVGNKWWLRGFVNRKLAEVIVQLIKDMASGSLSEQWADVTKGAIAENILHLTQLTEDERAPNTCIKTPTLWLALASLCVLDKDHVDRLSSGQWSNTDGQPSPPRPTCSNHDDGETNAVIQCVTCGNLCADCDRFLHLHRKTRNHQRQVCKEEEEAIKVELHEGCGRTKLFWLLALADARTLKALIEYREGGTRTRGAGISGTCRFCGTTGNSGLLAIGNICADQECQEYGKEACPKLLICGHMCGGVQGETKCLPCLYGCTNDPTLRQDADDMCMICFTEALSCAPAIQFTCGHVFHLHCAKAILTRRWSGPRITFSFSLCPICKVKIENEMLEDYLQPIKELYADVHRKALMRLEYEGLHTVEAIVTPGARFYNDPASYALDRYAYYVCYKCNKAYYGGEARCDAEAGDNYDVTELVCGACSDVTRAQMCPKHGTDYLEYKCRYCCSVAVFFCFGTTHFCNPCHDDFQRVTNLSKDELPMCPAGPKARQLDGDECPLHIKHPPTGEEFALGCGICRNAHTF